MAGFDEQIFFHLMKEPIC